MYSSGGASTNVLSPSGAPQVVTSAVWIRRKDNVAGLHGGRGGIGDRGPPQMSNRGGDDQVPAHVVLLPILALLCNVFVSIGSYYSVFQFGFVTGNCPTSTLLSRCGFMIVNLP